MSETPNTVAFVDDDELLRIANAQTFQLAGLEVWPFKSAAKALEAIDATFPGVVVTDIRMPGMDGTELFERLRVVDPDIPVILITGHGDVEQAVQAMHEGAYDFIAKPFSKDRLVQTVLRALEKRKLVMDNRRLRAVAEEAQRAWPMIGESVAMKGLRTALREASQADVDVLLEGETGVGKELAARALHNWGRRREHPFTAVNCGALPVGMVESELFGHELGAFPGAVRRRIGRIESSHRGTLLLDGVDAMPIEAQVKLLRFLEEREVSPLGTNETRVVDVRIVAASKPNAGHDGRLIPDLYHRLNVVKVTVPPLRERPTDIPLLFAHFLARAAERFGRDPPPLSEEAHRMLREHDWPGNVRELAHFAERLLLNFDVAADRAEGRPAPANLRDRVNRYEADLIVEALAANRGDVQRTVDSLAIPRKTFYDKVNRHGIDVDRHRRGKS